MDFIERRRDAHPGGPLRPAKVAAFMEMTALLRSPLSRPDTVQGCKNIRKGCNETDPKNRIGIHRSSNAGE
ncbi:hypothetical protein ACC817_26325 [Rhizobium ruizarguesonis]|uniref:hypothetical protein n=1 Tax=Rhizobium ruizarguesonis TaxID=2081791 RepID=UPI00102F45A2|nr:hypothetical protein [Rhizobium ruizarguesonis]TAY61929.1 hypothetical protein ELH84_34440 [Rhizobium ruizarguesonis]